MKHIKILIACVVMIVCGAILLRSADDTTGTSTVKVAYRVSDFHVDYDENGNVAMISTRMSRLKYIDGVMETKEIVGMKQWTRSQFIAFGSVHSNIVVRLEQFPEWARQQW